jgi:hypothetical protein
MYDTSTSLSEIEPDLTGKDVVFVNGDFTIDKNNSLDVGKYLMVVAKNNIIVDPSVNNINGVFVANNVGIGGTADSILNTLNINGVLYTTLGNVSMSRGFSNKSLNNTHPGVLVNYRPDLIFSMPGSLVKMISNWKQGF